jgi:hypothetical protein
VRPDFVLFALVPRPTPSPGIQGLSGPSREGDEFALLLTKTSSRGILQAVEKIRREISDQGFAFDAEHPSEHITVSVGLAGFDEAPGLGSEEILRTADDRLLRAKTLGRNRIVDTDHRRESPPFRKEEPSG